jgi:predicted O-methyltransferase YrrM
MAKIYIDNAKYMEFIDDIATVITELQFRDDSYEELKNDLDDDIRFMFTDEAQDLYNDTYDLIEGLLNRNLNIHSNNELINDN